MRRRFIIKVCGRDLFVNDIEYTTPIPTTTKECIPTHCIVSSVKFSNKPKTIIDPSLAEALVIGIRNIMPIRLEVVETWRD